MPATRRHLVVCSLCLAVALSAGATPLGACDPAWLPVARPDGISVFVALALAERVLDTLSGPIAARTHPAFGRRLDAYSGHSPGGQRVRLLQWDQAPTAREAVLVPWAYGSDCRPIAWADRLEWIPAGTRGAFTGWLRPRAHWLGGVPTFDVEMAWREPVWAEDEPRWNTGGGERRMTPEEFTTFYMALPTDVRLERRPREEAARMRQWEREHPSLAALAPASTLLAGIHRVAAERAGPALAGRWTAELRMDDSRGLPLAVRATTVTGELRLESVSLAPAVEGAGPAAVSKGTSTLDFTLAGFQLGSDEVLVMVEANSIRMILDPTVDHGHVVAVLTGGENELVGTWYLNSRPARARGSITLRRAR